MSEQTRIPNLPAPGKPCVFKMSGRARAQLELLQKHLTLLSGETKPIPISEVIRAAIDMAFTYHLRASRKWSRQLTLSEAYQCPPIQTPPPARSPEWNQLNENES